jgi:hypothetical protein
MFGIQPHTPKEAQKRKIETEANDFHIFCEVSRKKYQRKAGGAVDTKAFVPAFFTRPSQQIFLLAHSLSLCYIE